MAAMEAAYTFAETITVSEAPTWDDATPAVETMNLEAGDYILFKVTAPAWIFEPASSNPSFYTPEWWEANAVADENI